MSGVPDCIDETISELEADARFAADAIAARIGITRRMRSPNRMVGMRFALSGSEDLCAPRHNESLSSPAEGTGAESAVTSFSHSSALGQYE